MVKGQAIWKTFDEKQGRGQQDIYHPKLSYHIQWKPPVLDIYNPTMVKGQATKSEIKSQVEGSRIFVIQTYPAIKLEINCPDISNLDLC